MAEHAKIIAGEYTLAYVEKPDDAVWSVVGGGISDYNARQFASDQGKRLCFVVYGPDQEVVGGVIGETFWDWLYISLMFVKDELRSRGFGRQLLVLAEDEARGAASRTPTWTPSASRRQTSIKNAATGFLASCPTSLPGTPATS